MLCEYTGICLTDEEFDGEAICSAALRGVTMPGMETLLVAALATWTAGVMFNA
jgi:hypothetical protein